ncbi:MAG: hypothetical protein ACOYJG_11200 [Prevotella sp.]|jgi:hypothetical protein
MKKFTLFLFATFLATSTYGQRVLSTQQPSVAPGQNPMKEVRANAPKSLSIMREKLNTQRVAPRKDFNPTVTTVITEAPDGEKHENTFRSGNYYYAFYGYVFSGSNETAVGNYVVTDDAIYLKDLFSGIATNSYLKLDKTGDNTYVAHLPQAIYEQESNGTTTQYYATKLVLNADGSAFVPDTLDDGTIDQDVEFVLDNDTLKSVGLDESSIIGFTDNTYGWYGYGEFDIALFDNPYTVTDIPEGTTVEKWVLNESQLANIAIVEDEFYIQDPIMGDSGHWFKGTIEGNKVTFSGMQYLGVNPNYNMHAIFTPGTWEEVMREDSSTAINYALADEIVMNYDKDAKKLSAEDASGAFIINAALSRVYFLESYTDPLLYYYEEVAATPATPVITFVSEFYTDYGFGYMEFTLPPTDTEGKFIDTNKMYYNLYFDNSEEPEVFTTDTYQKLTEDMTNIPYSFTDNWEILADGSSHTITFYVAEYDNIGVSQSYTGGGETRRSEIYWAKNPAGIQGVTVNGKTVKSVNYYDLSGRKIAEPAQGLYIMEIQYADGSKKSIKRLAK